MLDLRPTAAALAALIMQIDDDRLTAPTPCTERSVGDLLDHVDGFAQAFAAAARKTPLHGGPPHADAANLGDDWRTRIPGLLDQLVVAWQDPRRGRA